VVKLLPESKWNYLMPVALPIFTYANFIKAIAHYPSFCNEKQSKVKLSLNKVCLRELATLFAHFG
jgi:hypothetical protein